MNYNNLNFVLIKNFAQKMTILCKKNDRNFLFLPFFSILSRRLQKF